MKVNKFLICNIFAIFCLIFVVNAEELKEVSQKDVKYEICFKDENFDVTVTCDEEKCPGEVFFVRMLIESHKKGKSIDINAHADLYSQPLKNLKSDKADNKTENKVDDSKNEIKPVCSSDFYFLEPYKKNHKNVTELLTGLPMWTWDKDSENARIIITYQINNEKEKTISIPVIIKAKEYPKETIKLNSSLSDLISKPDPEKKEQSKVLNELLATVNPKGVYDTSPFIRPMGGKRITSEFGQTRTFIYSNGKKAPSYHCGIDFGIPEGTEVVACAGGKVVMARWRIVTGYSVIIEHLPGLYSIYYHLSKLECAEGDIVKQGDLIALSGCTGLSTGPHLHWEIRLNSVCVNPDFFMSNYAFDSLLKDENKNNK